MFGVFLVADDMTQYWWHRISHTPLLWPLHRAHHSAKYMSLRITFRNNFFYYLLMPGLWMAGVLFYLGLGPVYAAYFVIKIAVIIGAHSAWRWDEPLYRIRALRPLMWVVERTISTPATHWAHHALTNADGIGHYKGNFGNLLFLWDIVFGSRAHHAPVPCRGGPAGRRAVRRRALGAPDVLSAGALAARTLGAAPRRPALRGSERRAPDALCIRRRLNARRVPGRIPCAHACAPFSTQRVGTSDTHALEPTHSGVPS